MKPANGLWRDAKIAKVSSRILERLTDLPKEVRDNKHNMELLSLVCNMIENSGIDNHAMKNAKLKIDKKSLLCQIYSSLYGNLSPADCELLSKNIEFLHDNGHIVKLSSWQMFAYCIAGWFKRKVLWTIQYIKEWLIGKAEDWIVNKFLDSMKVSGIVRAVLALDSLYFIRIILAKYGLEYLLNYVILFSVLWLGLFI
jgi:hypothetical protein